MTEGAQAGIDKKGTGADHDLVNPFVWSHMDDVAGRIAKAETADLMHRDTQESAKQIDTIDGETLDRSFEVLKPGGVLVSSVAPSAPDKASRHQVRGVFFLVSVTSEGLTKIADLLESGQLTTNVSEVLPLTEARLAHEMLAGKPHKPGKIVLAVGP